MKMVRMIMIASVAGLFAAAPFGLAHAVDAHNHGGAAKKAQTAPEKRIAAKKVKKSSRTGHMSMMQNCPMMQTAHAGKVGETRHSMMSGSYMSPRMQWHHNMMMWHHQMMRGQSPMHRGS